ncbi:uncharacterized protein LOC126744410 [Anthonomus grandis grandis]|uniref:uncharacterized protein LOC126744410 n=1 Tax=Anthonomus grandis grandis TaxID=2921223 RepID=UPI0021668051|nr:uncharacterized protein LOC126744410 [Anthonomus grandis grandis]
MSGFWKFAIVFCVLIVHVAQINGNFEHIKNPYFHFPYGGPYMGILTAFAVPLKAPTPGDVFIAVNFEATYGLPENQTEFAFPPIIAATARQILYNLFERKLESHGHPGKACLLRAICESTELSTSGTGILGDLVHLVLTPSTSLNTNLTKEYEEAEEQAAKTGHCKKYKKNCSFSVLKMFTYVGDILNKNGISKFLGINNNSTKI